MRIIIKFQKTLEFRSFIRIQSLLKRLLFYQTLEIMNTIYNQGYKKYIEPNK